MPDYVDSFFDFSSSVIKTPQNLFNAGVSRVKSALGRPPPPPPPPPPRGLSQALDSTLQKLYKFKFQICVASVLALAYAGGKALEVMYPTRRRAKTLESGQRFEVVLVIGNPSSVVVQKLIHDLNERGYIVFVSVSSENEMTIIEKERDNDIRPLLINFESEATVKNSLLRLASFLDTEASIGDSNSDGKYLYHFKGALVIPDYFKFPKCSSMDDLKEKEFQNIFTSHFFKLNSLLQNGVISFLQESNKRKHDIAAFNNTDIDGGNAKLIFFNFIPVSQKENRKLMLSMSLDINNLLFQNIYKENQKSYNTLSVFSSLKCMSNIDPNYVDMTMLTINYYKDDESKLISPMSASIGLGSSGFFIGNGQRNKKITTGIVHRKVFDLLNASWLYKGYTISN